MMVSVGSASRDQVRTIPAVLSQHAESSAFLWLLRRAAVSQPHYRLQDLAKLDDQLDAHLDGLRTHGESGWGIVSEALLLREPGEVFTAALVAFESGLQDCIHAVLGVAVGGPGLEAAVISSLGWLPFTHAQRHLTSLFDAPDHSMIGLAGSVIHRADPGPVLSAAVAGNDDRLMARALRAIGELGRLDLVAIAKRSLKADDGDVLFSAAWSTALLSGNPEALSALAAVAQSDSRHRERALQTAMRRAGLGAAKVWLRRLAQEAATLRLAVQGAGAIGDPAEIPWLIDQMHTPELARVAGESFTTITGVDIVYQDLEGERPDGFESGPTEDPADENVQMDADENLPWPDPGLIQKWWASNRHSFQPGTRYLIGKPITIDWCKQVLRIGRQRQRAAAALELAMRQPGTPLFEVRAPGFRQKRLLGI